MKRYQTADILWDVNEPNKPWSSLAEVKTVCLDSEVSALLDVARGALEDISVDELFPGINTIDKLQYKIFKAREALERMKAMENE